jgi:hypothetical protein
MAKHIIRYAEGELAAAIDALRDTLAAVAGPELVTRYANPQKWNSYWHGNRRHMYWQGRKLNQLALAALLQQLGIVFHDATGRPLVKPPRNVLRVFLSVAADYDWFNPDRDCGAWMRKHNPSDFYNQEFLKTEKINHERQRQFNAVEVS